jgi:hypothetical protein
MRLSHLQGLENDDDGRSLFRLIYEAQETIFTDLCQIAKVAEDDIGGLTAEKLMKLDKKQLSGYLETMCCLVDKYVIPELNKNVNEVDQLRDNDFRSQVDYLKREKISDQETIIDLQSKLIDSKNEQLKSVKTTIQTEMKSYANVVEKSGAISDKKIVTAIEKLSVPKDDRSKNLIVFGVEEEQEEAVEQRVIDILAHLDEKPRIRECSRVGTPKQGATRPVRFTLSSSDLAHQILRKAAQLRSVDGCKNIYISPDRTFEQRLAHRTLVEELKKKRGAEPEKLHLIRNFKIISVEKEATSSDS